MVSGQAVTTEGQQTVHQALGFINVFLLVFGFIALFVGSFVIFNTFSIIVAQRLRELALLRAVGASRLQVMASVLGESLVIGVLAAAAGVVAGIGLAVALKAGLAAIGFDLPATGLVVSPRTIVTVSARVLITLIWPSPPPAARPGSRRSPPCRMWRPSRAGCWPGASRRGGPGRRRCGGAGPACSATTGTGSCWSARARRGVYRRGCPGAARRPPGQPRARRPARAARHDRQARPAERDAQPGAHGRDGRGPDGGRHPGSLMTIVASSIKASADAIIDSAMRADYVINSGGAPGGPGGFSPGLERSLAALPQVSTATGIRSGVVQIYGKTATVVATDPAKAAPLFNVGVRTAAWRP